MKNSFFKLLLIGIISISLLGLSSCGKKKKKTVEDIRKEFNQKPTPKYLSFLKKHYKKTNNDKEILEISKVFYKAFPNDKYIKQDIGKAYASLAKKEKGEVRLGYLMKAVEFGHSNSLVVQELSALVLDKLKAFEKTNNDKELLAFLETTKKLPLSDKLKMTINSKLDILKNKEVFEKFYTPFKAELEKKVEKLLADNFKNKAVVYNKEKGLFLLRAAAPVAKGDSDKNNYAKTKQAAYDVNSEQFTILKYVLEHGKKPPVGKEFSVLFFPKEEFKCESVVLSKDKKALQLTCAASILEIGKAFFSVREENKKEDKKENKKTDSKKDKKAEK